jgi:dipeptidyl-peptidase-3
LAPHSLFAFRSIVRTAIAPNVFISLENLLLSAASLVAFMASGGAPADHILKTGFEVGDLHVERVIPSLTPEQLRYATYLALASWAGLPILLAQVSHESPGIHAFLSAFYSHYPRAALEAVTSQKDGALFHLLEYAATFFYNSGNYLGFGNTNFIPRIAKPELVALVAPYPDLAAKPAAVVDTISDDSDNVLTLGWGRRVSQHITIRAISRLRKAERSTIF